MTTAINTAAAAVTALDRALAAVAVAVAAAPDCPALAAALAVSEAALSLANQGLDRAIGDESVEWRPGLCEAIVAGV